MHKMNSTIDVILPVHNEGAGIGQTLKEIHEVVVVGQGFPLRMILCEDGSTDNTVEVIQGLADQIPLLLNSDPVRKSYSRAVLDGIRASTSDLVCFIDSDGQFDPADFASLYHELHNSKCDLVVGYRHPRQDGWVRVLMSSLFNQVYKRYFSIRLRDPSCSFLLIRREALLRTCRGKIGILKQGFWWEFYARAYANDVTMRQVPVRHRPRTSGVTQVYQLSKVPRIAWTHLRGLAELRRELQAQGKEEA